MKSRTAAAFAGLLANNPSSTTGFSASLSKRAASAMAALLAGPSPENAGMGRTSCEDGAAMMSFGKFT
jgi:hypothetical protein